jgi:CRISPR type IV-associated protein Csf2
MESYIFEGTVTALSSVVHNGGQSFGINSKLRREKFVQLDGSVEEVPVISGNSMRGLLRDRGMLHMVKSLGYGVNTDTGEVSGLSLPAFYFLFSGGSLTSDAGRGLDIDRARYLQGLIPLVGVFGGAMGNQIMPGKVKIGKMLPIVAETKHLMPDRFAETSTSSVWNYLQEEMYTRKDDEKNEHMRQLIAPETRKLLADKAAAQKIKSEAGKPQDDTGQHQQMMYYVESFAAGTPFYWKIVLDDVTDIEFEAFLTTLVEFSKKPYIGGKSAVGLGEVSVKFDHWLRIDSRVQVDNSLAITTPIGAVYSQHLKDKCGEIRSALDEIK